MKLLESKVVYFDYGGDKYRIVLDLYKTVVHYVLFKLGYEIPCRKGSLKYKDINFNVASRYYSLSKYHKIAIKIIKEYENC
ncbi:hypothetical protein [Sigmofec virus UA08Rod_3874]|uniref:Uncharacterized protein n=1 Tax=Sigmofec virus UA08Rod_3874 TaxID=2929391 RepID=A0A976R5E1_9VIRU|nr:hypothetical protein [Sigmofec virus UA08Rod_3874]